ncbi:MAG: type IV pilus secretin PilQ [Polyangiaceae bacterium]|nr:type IV pilus secretin PilQ [Polyangiaceae bacterium]
MPRVSLGALCLLGSLGFSAPALAGPSTGRVTEVKATKVGEGAEISIVSSRPPQYSARVADQGRRIILDLTDTEVDGAPPALIERAGVVGGVMTQTFRSEQGPVTRVIISLLQTATYQIRTEGNVLQLSLRPATTTGPGTIEERARPATSPEALSPAEVALVREVRFHHGKEVEQVRMEVTAHVHAVPIGGTTGRSRLELRGAKLRAELERTLDVGAFGGKVKTISTYRHPSGSDTVVVEVEHAANLVGSLHQDGGVLVWSFAPKVEGSNSQTRVAPDGGIARRTRTVAREEVTAGLPKIEGGLGEESSGESGAFTSAPLGQQRGVANNAPRRYTGARVDLDMKDADVHNVLRILADVGKVNIVTADNVKGDVTLRLRNVPWDQALDVVLQAKGLGMIRQGNMIRVAPLADLEKEREMAIARRKQELELAPVETRLIPVSYADAATMQGRAKELLSPRGSIAVDDRTNVLIVRDVAGNLNQIEELVKSLDTQTPQVLVEARIVEATSRYLRDIGIQWGGDATFSPATGNPTGLAFPTSVTAVGGAHDAQTPTAGLSPFTRIVQNPNFAINLPAAVGTGQGGALGLSFGSLNNAVNLAVRLSAAESSGMLRIVSSPRILTLDNKEATIAQGTLIPFSQISAQGVQTNFQEAKLQLKVRPHVTSDGSISMHVKINRDEPDFNQTSARGDPTILKREAETDLLVMDGHTAVIGGIFTRNTGRNLDQVPFFGDIPLLGILFQRRRSSDSRSELVIFLSPRIVNRAEALGR